MQINSVARHLLAPLGAGSSTDEPEGSPNPQAIIDRPRDDDLAIDRGGNYHQILADYDMENITPRQFGELVQRLHQSGAIDDAEFRQLARVRTELEQSGFGPDQPIDLIAYLEQDEAAAQSKFNLLRQDPTSDSAALDEAEQAMAEARARLEWIRKFALIHAAGGDGIDAGA